MKKCPLCGNEVNDEVHMSQKYCSDCLRAMGRCQDCGQDNPNLDYIVEKLVERIAALESPKAVNP